MNVTHWMPKLSQQKRPKPRPARSRIAFTVIELLVVIAVLVLAASLLLPALQRARERAKRISCTCNLKQIGLSFRTWTVDHYGQYPMQTPLTNGGLMEITSTAPAYVYFPVMSNELSTPKILVCPADKSRRPATNFGVGFSNTNLSYFVGLGANETSPQMFLSGDRNLTNGLPIRNGFLDLVTNIPVGWTHELHGGQGNIGLADGRVQQFSMSSLRQGLVGAGEATNRLAMP